MVRRTLEEIRAAAPRVDHAKLGATTEEDIRRHMIEDGQDPDEELRLEDAISPREIRKRLTLSQAQIAARLRVPLATWRNWEQGRVRPDPAARTLLAILAKDPERVLALLAD